MKKRFPYRSKSALPDSFRRVVSPSKSCQAGAMTVERVATELKRNAQRGSTKTAQSAQMTYGPHSEFPATLGSFVSERPPTSSITRKRPATNVPPT